MRVLMLSWEYPPVVVGGLGRHVHALSVALAAAGHEVTVVTRHGSEPDGTDAPLDEIRDGVRVVRAPADPPLFPFSTETLLAFTMSLNHALTRAALRVAGEQGFDVVHGHDWLVTHAAVTLKHHLGVPLVATVHATEAGRHSGWLPGELNRCIHSVEWWLTYEARRVLVCSDYMRWEVSRLFELPGGKVRVIPNGVDPAAFAATPGQVRAARQRFGGDGPLVVYAGRLVHEKGVQDLIAATPTLRRRFPGLRVVVAGEGKYAEELVAEVRRRRLSRTVEFVGFLDAELPALFAAADCAVVPSRYEPFGMVAVEAASAGAPLAVSATGGLGEFVAAGLAAVSFAPKDPRSLAEAVSSVLADEVLARRLARQGRSLVAERYAWPVIAERTLEAYGQAQRDERALRAAGTADGPIPPIVVPDGNLLRDGSA
ncbi:glycosyltransferase family 4 protein [Actinocatenispora sera]|uniref:Glycogen synthase n=1 Tax=Actinocatenispora sera TaxID=390989 RepID=A0A810L9F5_9ACTN|nr:glycosyltransferase family 4 protein [Actinocatenispora sera]BCJ31222.1 glycogen synthase [Actinocatenispora sera]